LSDASVEQEKPKPQFPEAELLAEAQENERSKIKGTNFKTMSVRK
jgi:hypothetical protein